MRQQPSTTLLGCLRGRSGKEISLHRTCRCLNEGLVGEERHFLRNAHSLLRVLQTQLWEERGRESSAR